jgi:hypothetical protein
MDMDRRQGSAIATPKTRGTTKVEVYDIKETISPMLQTSLLTPASIAGVTLSVGKNGVKSALSS